MSDTQGNKKRCTPAPIFLIYFPHLYGATYAAIIQGQTVAQLLYTCCLLFGGTIFFSNAAHAWNDLVDAPIDGLIPRTKNRPIPRGALSSLHAFLFASVQALGAVGFLLVLPERTVACTIPTIIGTTYYPWAKRHTYFPQVVLGFCLAWGVMVGASAMGSPSPWSNEPLICLLLACLFWVIIYDTIYSHMDVEEDVKLGVRSMAVLFQSSTKPLLWFILACMLAALVRCGILSGLGQLYNTFAVGGPLASQSLMLVLVDLRDPETCWWWFANGFWVSGGSITSGLIAEYVARVW